ncbi:Uncharacterised protein [Dorea longicatena]|nr:Uncharacterised protein [Dorea longicatena]
MIFPQECNEFVITVVISVIPNPPGNPKNSIAQIVDKSNAITGVPKNSSTGCTGFINGITDDNVFKMIKNSGNKIILTIKKKFGLFPFSFSCASFSFSR